MTLSPNEEKGSNRLLQSWARSEAGATSRLKLFGMEKRPGHLQCRVSMKRPGQRSAGMAARLRNAARPINLHVTRRTKMMNYYSGADDVDQAMSRPTQACAQTVAPTAAQPKPPGASATSSRKRWRARRCLRKSRADLSAPAASMSELAQGPGSQTRTLTIRGRSRDLATSKEQSAKRRIWTTRGQRWRLNSQADHRRPPDRAPLAI